VDEHDFYQGKYLAGTPDADSEGNSEDDAAPPVEAPKIKVEVAITNLSLEQQARVGGQVEWLKASISEFYDEPDPAGVDATDIVAALRVTFIGEYDADEDDFIGNTYFTRTLTEEETPTPLWRNGMSVSQREGRRPRRAF
jgi:putative ATP-dependent endonuclease of OLD family